MLGIGLERARQHLAAAVDAHDGFAVGVLARVDLVHPDGQIVARFDGVCNRGSGLGAAGKEQCAEEKGKESVRCDGHGVLLWG